jgi:hypothetical protein
MFREIVAVYSENHTEQTHTLCAQNAVRTSQETHYVSATEPNRLMLFGETAAVYFKNHTEHINTARTSQETHYVSATEPKRLMLFGETAAVYCEKLKLKLYYDRQSVGKSVLVSGAHLGPATNFSSSLKFPSDSVSLLFYSTLSDERTGL